MKIASLILGLCFSFSASAWTLDNDSSRLSFVTNKAGTVAEVHRFTRLEGSVDAGGSAVIGVELSSISTLLPDRDQRLRDILFEVASYPKALIRAEFDPSVIDDAKQGSQTRLPVTVNMHGMEVSVTPEVTVTQTASGKLVVSSLEPVVVYGYQFGFMDAIEELRTIAGLPSISPAVTVQFYLTFEP